MIVNCQVSKSPADPSYLSDTGSWIMIRKISQNLSFFRFFWKYWPLGWWSVWQGCDIPASGADCQTETHLSSIVITSQGESPVSHKIRKSGTWEFQTIGKKIIGSSNLVILIFLQTMFQSFNSPFHLINIHYFGSILNNILQRTILISNSRLKVITFFHAWILVHYEKM